MQFKIPVMIWISFFMCMTLKTGFADESYYNKSYALVVGISKYASVRWKNLPYARSDAENVAKLLKDKGFEVLSLYDRDATRHAILARLERNISPRLQPEDRVLFYFSGHGYSKKIGDGFETYLIPYDKENINMNASQIYISMSDLERQSKIMSIAKHQLFLIDAPIKVIDQANGNGIILTDPEYLKLVTQKKARQILAAGKNKKLFEERSETIHNVLSKYFVKGLDNGKADINGDGNITCLELCSYIMPRATNSGQKPDYATFPGHDMGEFVFFSPESIRKQIAEEDKELEIVDLTVEKKAPPIVDIQEGRLFLKTVPENARIRILNIVPPYRYGMMLSPGNYKIEVSKPGYQTKIQWFTIANQDRIHETIKLRSHRLFSQLFVMPDPSDARIRIMNIVPPYSHGMSLQAGRYLIEVDKPGYKPFQKWVTISKGKDLTITPVLQSKTQSPLKKNTYHEQNKSTEIKESILKPDKQFPSMETTQTDETHEISRIKISKSTEKNDLKTQPKKTPTQETKQEIHPKPQAKQNPPPTQRTGEKTTCCEKTET